MANNTKYVILGLLTEAPLSGYEIKKLVDIRFRFFWSESYGQIYPELKRLTAMGLIDESLSSDARLSGQADLCDQCERT
ncbi:MAG: PadR family transcriptional regulator [Candidatus Moduliflexus flocculans]|nr:PadR family transcriptional regulator [Candidatus Moduliflexus flocculans]